MWEHLMVGKENDMGEQWKEVWQNGYATKDRNLEIYKAREQGETFASIGKRYNICTERARQIWKKVKRIVERRGE